MTDGSWLVTRFSTALSALCWMKRVISSLPIENCCQLMIAPGVLVIVSMLPEVLKLAPPEATVPPVGLPKADSVCPASAAPTAKASVFLGRVASHR